MNQKDFIKMIAPAAARACAGTRIFPSVAIARAIIESGDGKGNYGDSALNRANNYFGITASKSYTGDKILIKTWEGKKIATYGEEKFLGEKNGRYNYTRYFRAYDTPEESFKDFVKLVSNGRYKEATQATTPEEQAEIISNAGYATAANAKELFMSVTKKVAGALQQVKAGAKEAGKFVEKNAAPLLVAAALVGAIVFVNRK